MSIDQSKKYIRNKGISLDGCKDPYDFYIMVTALKDKADYLLTTNTKDFPNPLGFCKVINVEELLSVLPIYP